MAAQLDRSVVCPVLIGRIPHTAALRRLFQRSKSGSGQTVLIAGEAGVGKTRLVVSTHTVHAHLRAIYGKLAVTSRAATTRFAVDHQLV